MALFLQNPSEIWPTADATQLKLITRLIDRAEALVMQRFPTLEKRLLTGALSVTVVAGVVEDMVTRAVAHLDRGGVEKLSYPEISLEWASGGAGTGSLLYLTVDELLVLTPPDAPGAFTVYRRPRPR
ncbi:hypothetical protein ACFLIN_03770 [Corynebacterium kutscheri]|uniref:hypothetical protein n=1 Tax=Corynebacterium kutscheri TaxID=35755 RepID=UPI0037BF5B8D